MAYLEFHGACLGGVKGIEEVMGIGAGICKVERAEQVRVAEDPWYGGRVT